MPLQGARLRQVGHDAHTVPSFPAIVAAQVRIAAVEEDRGLHPPSYHLIGEGTENDRNICPFTAPGSDWVSYTRGEVGVESCGDGRRPLRNLRTTTMSSHF